MKTAVSKTPKIGGPRSYYRPKCAMPMAILLTDHGWTTITGLQRRTGASRSDIVEFLLRHYGRFVSFALEELS